MLHLNQVLFQDTIKLNITANFYQLKNQHPISKNYQIFQISKVNKKFGIYAESLLNKIQLEADEQYRNANIQNFLELDRNTAETTTSRKIFHNGERPRKTSEGIVVIKAIGIKILKNILKEKENEFNVNLPM